MSDAAIPYIDQTYMQCKNGLMTTGEPIETSFFSPLIRLLTVDS